MNLVNYLFVTENINVALIQLLGYFALIYYSIKSIMVFRIGFSKEHKEQGSLPVLAFVYFMFSVFFIGIFIRNYGQIFMANKIALLENSNYFDNIKFIAKLFNLSILTLLLAFTLNFSKSFFTLNALEFGVLTVNDYGKKLYNGKSKYIIIIDTLLKTFIAIAFVRLEHILSESEHLFASNDLSAFIKIGWFAFFLYLFTLIWLFYNKIVDNNNSSKILNNWWFWNSLIQFLSGFFISFSLILTGYSFRSDSYINTILGPSSFKTIGLITSGVVVIFSIIVCLTIILNEIKPKRYYNVSN